MIEVLEEHKAMLAEGFGSALIGYTNGAKVVAVYDYEACVEILMEADALSYEEALEWMEYNLVASHVGDATPVFITLA